MASQPGICIKYVIQSKSNHEKHFFSESKRLTSLDPDLTSGTWENKSNVEASYQSIHFSID